MVHSAWLVDAIKDISEYAREEQLEGVLEGLSLVLETYAIEAGLEKHQQDEVLSLLSPKTPESSNFRCD